MLKQKICSLRTTYGYSQEYMAELLHISLNSYRKIEKGETKLISDRLGQIAAVFGIPIQELLLSDYPLRQTLSVRDRESYESEILLLKKYNSYLEELIVLLKEKLPEKEPSR